MRRKRIGENEIMRFGTSVTGSTLKPRRTRAMKKRVAPTGIRRADRSRYPYEPRVVGGKLMTPVGLQRLHRFILDTAVIEDISDEMRTVVETLWPELVDKLPPKQAG